MNARRLFGRLTTLVGVGACFTFAAAGAFAGPLDLRDTPLFLNQSAPPLNMLVMGRDHKLYYEAYNDASDLNGDGQLDVGYKPDEIDYYGLFDSYACYNYSSGRFIPAFANDPALGRVAKKCPGRWSGDFLNYLTTSRIDALRKVLYGGSRWLDDDDDTILQRANIPQDAHSWGKEYESIARDGFDIREYTPLPLPNVGRRHLFANTTLRGDASQLPRLRYRENANNRIWEWVSVERPVAAGSSTQDWVVRVEACVPGRISDAERPNCKRYPDGNLKPIGLLQKYGENDQMLFGLLTGSYDRNTEGGRLRKNVGTIRDEIDSDDGTFLSTVGVIRTIDRLAVTGFDTGFTHSDNCGWITTRPINPGECRMWGNPVGEMIYEALRYFADRGAPTPAFVTGGVGSDESALGLPRPGWDRPYSTNSRCAKPFMTVVSDINPSFDTNAMPGSMFGGISTDLPGFNAASSTDAISSGEGDIAGTNRFIGQSAAVYDGAPTPKIVGSLATVRGLSPEEPTKQGGFLGAGAAYWGNITDVSPAQGRQEVQTFAVALASPLPRIEIPFGSTTVTLVPFAKSVGGFGISAAQGAFQPTNTIVDFYYDQALSNPPNRYFFRINYEDVEQGADHDMDAIVEYDIRRVGPTQLEVTLNSTYAAGSIIHHLGYVISGTTRDGIYLEVRDRDTSAGADPQYFLDTPPGQWAGSAVWNDGVALPFSTTRTFDVGTTPGATLLRDPLWYAAKWGGFVDSNNNDLPDLPSEWNQDNDPAGTPDNYFLVTNALKLSDQLSKAFDTIVARSTSASSVALNSGSLSSETRVYQAKFNSGDWTGQLLSFKINADGSVPVQPEWDAAANLPTPSARTIITTRTDGTPIPFRWTALDPLQQSLLDPASDGLGDERLDYLRGDGTLETSQPGGVFRNRASKLGDIIASSPVFVGAPRAAYRDDLEAVPYSTFRRANATRTPVVYAGANDGMVHGFHAGASGSGGGTELLAFVPRAVFRNLHHLTRPTYNHKFFVDGSPTAVDIFASGQWRTLLTGGLNLGGQSIYALDVTDPGAFTEGNAGDVFRWEFDDRDLDGAGPDRGDRDLGFTYSRPVVGKMRHGPWAVIFGNGYNNVVTDGAASATGNAVLYVLDAWTGDVIRKIDTGVGIAQDPTGAGRPNGLAGVAAADVDLDNVVDYVYAGDLYGNLWKFNLTSTNPVDWDVAIKSGSTNLPLFVARNSAGNPQPITTRPVIGRGPRGLGTLVLFGTGKYLEPGDKDVTQLATTGVMTFYGIYDRMQNNSGDVVLRSDLMRQEISAEETRTFGTKTVTVRVTTENQPTSAHRGWFLDLRRVGGPFEGEMQVSDAILRSGRVIFTTLIPSQDPCSFGGTGWLMALDAMTGARVTRPQFDLNYDGLFDSGDAASGGQNVTGIRSELGIVQKPGILADNQSDNEYIVVSGTGGDVPQGVEGGTVITAPNGDRSVTATRGKTGAFDRGRQSWRQLR